jgi:putative (di)nucleoside polyphosphate hydrolase
VIDKKGFRLGVAIMIVNEQNRLFWARRLGRTGWQFPQGGLDEGETPLEGMYRELYEEVGLQAEDVEVIAESKRWIYYYLPKHLIREHSKPLCIGQKQKWFLLRLKKGSEAKVNFNTTELPEFEAYRWVRYWYPLKQVIFFKKQLYKRALNEFAGKVFSAKRKPQAKPMDSGDKKERED